MRLFIKSISSQVDGRVETDVRGKRWLSVTGGKPAGENGYAGYYVHQVAGYCEDDYSGEMYLSLGENKFLRMDFALF